MSGVSIVGSGTTARRRPISLSAPTRVGCDRRAARRPLSREYWSGGRVARLRPRVTSLPAVTEIRALLDELSWYGIGREIAWRDASLRRDRPRPPRRRPDRSQARSA